MRTFFVTLNWNTETLAAAMIDSIEETTPEPHTWVILDNGSRDFSQLLEYTAMKFAGRYALFGDKKESWGNVTAGVDCVVMRINKNLGCVLGHNLCFDMVQRIAGDEEREIVMVDTDVEVFQPSWLTAVHNFIGTRDDIGVVGLEHSRAEVCAAAVFLDKFANWYTHGEQPQKRVVVPAESVGLGMAVLRHPVSRLRFDTGFKLYYKQDDDLCFQARFDLDKKVYAFPIDMVHFGSGALRINEYNVDDAHGWDAFDMVKQDNQRYFAAKWADRLDNRRATLTDEIHRLERMHQKTIHATEVKK